MRYFLVLLLSVTAWAQMPKADSLLALWYSNAGVTTVTNHVSAQADQGAAGSNLAQATENLRPQTLLDTLNGHAGIRYQAPGEANRYLALGAKLLSTTTARFTMMFYFRPDSIDGALDQALLGQTLPNSQIFDAGAGARLELQYGRSGTIAYRGSTDIKEDTLYLAFLIHGVAADSMLLKVNNSTLKLESSSYRLGAFSAGNDASATNLTVGQNAGARYFVGTIFAMAVWRGALTTTQISQAETEVLSQFTAVSTAPPIGGKKSSIFNGSKLFKNFREK